jgi:rsbT antagonist protein RsbS
VARVPILRLGERLIVTFPEDLHDNDALDLQQNLSDLLVRAGARGIILDISVVQMVDSFLGRLIGDIATTSRLLGATTVVVGLQPAVAITLVELGLQLRGVQFALDLEKGLALLRRRFRAEAGRARQASR